MAVISELKLKSKNLFNKNNIDTTRHLTVDASVFKTSALATYNCSSFIPVKPNTTYIKSGNFGASVQAYFDSDKNFIGTATLVVNNTPFTTPSNCVYIVVNVAKANSPFDTAQLEAGSRITEYNPYYSLDVKRYDNETIREIVHKDNKVEGLPNGTYHFAKRNEVESNICENAVNEPIIDMEIQGKSSQDGTPTPETPVEIFSVGDKTKNLFDLEDLLNAPKGILFGTSGNSIEATNLYKIELKANTTYTMSSYGLYGSLDEPVDVNRSLYFQYADVQNCVFDGHPVTVTTDSTGIIPIALFATRSNATPLLNKTAKVMVEEGNTETQYEPYGYRIPVKARGKNLFGNYETLENQYINSSGTILEIQGINTYRYIPVEPNTTYTISGKSKGIGYIRVAEYDSSKGFVKRVYNDVMVNPTITITTTSTTKYLALCPDANFTDGTVTNSHIYDIQIEKNSTATEYEPYIVPREYNIYVKELLRKVGTYVDTLDYKNKKVVRNVGVYTFNGEESFYNAGSGFPYGFKIGDILNNYIKGSNIPLLSNEYRNVINTEIDKTTGTGAFCQYSSNWYFNYDNQTIGATAFGDILKSKYESGNPVKVYYSLETPVEEQIEVPEILTLDGTTTLEIDTNIEPSALSVTYWKQI